MRSKVYGVIGGLVGMLGAVPAFAADFDLSTVTTNITTAGAAVGTALTAAAVIPTGFLAWKIYKRICGRV